MKPVNIYTLTRINTPERLMRLERQMSKRSRYLKIKEWETEGLKSFTDNLCEALETAPGLEFYYSFTMPKLGKEFDLIRVCDNSVINIELKSGNVGDEVIRNQLLQNRYYLSTLGLDTHFYTYISNSDRLVRLSNSGKLVETDFEELSVTISEQGACYRGDIEELFKEENYLISPLTDPGRFLRQEYFLTSQQRDIEKQILKHLRKSDADDPASPCGFTGLPGTGKTILLYDLAMRLSKADKVCVLNFGSHLKGLEELDSRLKRIDFYYCEEGTVPDIKEEYKTILVDGGHRINKASLEKILFLSDLWKAPVIFSYDREDAIAIEERRGYGAELIESLKDFVGHRLTNRIRLNSDLSSFINTLMSFKERNIKHDYPAVRLSYGADDKECERLLTVLENEGYVHIGDNNLSEASCKEFDRVVMVMDESFCYDEAGNLRDVHLLNGETGGDVFKIRNLFHGLSRAKQSIAIIVKNNLPVFDVVLYILQK